MTLSHWLSIIERTHPNEIELGLGRVLRIARLIDLHHFLCPVITVAGTNGKGSTVSLLESMYVAQGYSVGTYTSPHLLRFNERVCVNGEPVADEKLCQAFQEVNDLRQDIPITYFEFSTLAALWLFQRESLDVLILEVGLGGRLDAVNIVDSDVAVLTSLGIDHTKWLGEDRESIGREKAGIFRPDKMAVCGDPNPPASVVEVAAEKNTKLFCVEKDFHFDFLPETTLLEVNAQTAAQYYGHDLSHVTY